MQGDSSLVLWLSNWLRAWVSLVYFFHGACSTFSLAFKQSAHWAPVLRLASDNWANCSCSCSASDFVVVKFATWVFLRPHFCCDFALQQYYWLLHCCCCCWVDWVCFLPKIYRMLPCLLKCEFTCFNRVIVLPEVAKLTSLLFVFVSPLIWLAARLSHLCCLAVPTIKHSLVKP